jgi:hypothetical protein
MFNSDLSSRISSKKEKKKIARFSARENKVFHLFMKRVTVINTLLLLKIGMSHKSTNISITRN